MTGESPEWRPIPGFDGAYEITAQGDIRSWKVWNRDKRPLPRLMTVKRHSTTGRRMIQLGLHGGTHDVDELVNSIFPPEKTVDELIEASSLGTPEAMAIRPMTPPEVTDEIMREMKSREGH